MKFLVDLRADVLRVGEATTPSSPISTASCRQHSRRCSTSACSRCTRITWDAPAALLEKLIEYEAVHAIDSWDDLKNRLDSDRRCYAFFHPAMPNEPLVFVEIALTTGIATELAAAARRARARPRCRARRHRGLLFDLELPARPRRREPRHRADQAGRRGSCTIDLPQLRRFVTLSPIPGFRALARSRACASGDAAGRRARAAAGRTGARARPARRRPSGTSTKRSGPRSWRCARATSRPRTTAASLDPVANFHSPTARVDRTDQLARRPEPDRPRALGRADGRTTCTSPIASPGAPRRYAGTRRDRRVRRRCKSCSHEIGSPPVEKLVYLIWDRPSRDPEGVRAQIARRPRAAIARRWRRAGSQMRRRRRGPRRFRRW